ncbi:MAG: 2-isopropylmalate synthase [Fervidicoccus fontis]|uniref:2-isopropylmalate synthase n=1 Tax=Thermodesulfobium acidiphilum TaxID=1794699 RepID=A0A2R4VZR4_THEAF|nr:2-isopropylmalate synthase [Thermodesulfobium acidiphilum]AWB09910.1 2-isopropylmalate synthase [Thermodesulfobium acidiphilum]PMB77005.1 MAG: 2-isopropylmalate synthase [Fervidicoccus fontis]HEM56113.1 2-isopropylmalate synthase [Thermodesulfobium narugense]
MKRIKIFDTTLRDGEQSPGVSLNSEEKCEIAKQLARLNVDCIEAGFPIASEGDFKAVQQIAREVEGPIIAALARAKKEDIDRAWEAIKDNKNPRIHTFLATSDLHLEKKLQISREVALSKIRESVTYARSLCTDVEFSAEDASRSDLEFLARCVSVAIESGAKTINIPDTVGYATPSEMAEIIRYLKENVRGIENVDISVHCHNDLGLAVANSLASIEAGASQVECTINGIGERAGNAALEEIVMALYVRKNFYQSFTNINTQEIYRTSRLVSSLTGMNVQANKAIVGANAFAHESGIHQDGVLKDKRTYEILDSELIGLTGSQMVLGKHSGRHAFRKRIEDLGFKLSSADLNKAFIAFKEMADKKQQIHDMDLVTLISDIIFQGEEFYRIDYVGVFSGTNSYPTATVVLENSSGERLVDSGIGNGSVDAIYKTIEKIVNLKLNLIDFNIKAITGGTDALGEVTVRVQDSDNRVFIGRGSDTDILIASAKAFVSSVNKMISYKSMQS